MLHLSKILLETKDNYEILVEWKDNGKRLHFLRM